MPNLDGIKKLSKDEMDKSRKIILDIIGENAPKKTITPEVNTKKMDSANITLPKPNPKPPIIIKKEVKPVSVNHSADLPKKETDAMIIWDNLRTAESKMKKMQSAEEREFHLAEEKNKLIDQVKNQPDAKIINYKKSVDVPIIISSNQKKSQNNKERIESEDMEMHQKKETQKLEERKKIKMEKEKASLAKKEQKKLESENRRKLWLTRWQTLKKSSPKIIKITFYSLLLIISGGIIIYVSAGILLLKFNKDSVFTRKINSLIPVPAIISPIGIVNYYQYKEIAAREANSPDIKANIHRAVVQNILLENLARKKDWSEADIQSRSGDFLSKLNEQVLKDETINNVALKRIKKIQSMAAAARSLSDAKKFSDDYSFGGYLKKEEVELKFGLGAYNQPLNNISEIIYHNDGYYIMQIFEQFENTYGVNYVFIKGRTLNDYLNDETDKLKIWSFI